MGAVKWQRYANGNLWAEIGDQKFVIEQDKTPTPILREFERLAWNDYREVASASYRTERGAKIAVGRMYSTQHPSAGKTEALTSEPDTKTVPESADHLDADPTIAELKQYGYSGSDYNLAAIAEVVRDWLEQDVDAFAFVDDIASKHKIKG